jgi:hypothetical protein
MSLFEQDDDMASLLHCPAAQAVATIADRLPLLVSFLSCFQRVMASAVRPLKRTRPYCSMNMSK